MIRQILGWTLVIIFGSTLVFSLMTSRWSALPVTAFLVFGGGYLIWRGRKQKT